MNKQSSPSVALLVYDCCLRKHKMALYLMFNISFINRSLPSFQHEYVCCAQSGNTRLPPRVRIPHSGKWQTTLFLILFYIRETG